MKKISIILISVIMVLSVASCGKNTQPEKLNAENASVQQTDAQSVQPNANYELILKTDHVRNEFNNSGYGNNFLHKSGDFIYYFTIDRNPCLTSLKISTGETKQIAYADVDYSIQYSKSKLLFKGSENGYNMQLMQYDFASQKLSKVNESFNSEIKLYGSSLVKIIQNEQFQYELQYIDLNTNGIETVSCASDFSNKSFEIKYTLGDTADENTFYFIVSANDENDYNNNKYYLYEYHTDTKQCACAWNLSCLESESLVSRFLFDSDYNESEHIVIANHYLYVFTEEQGVYTVDNNGKAVQISQYPADRYLTYDPDREFCYQDNAIYYRAAEPHSDYIVKLENGKETIIKTAEQLQSDTINFDELLISNTTALYNDEIWYTIYDEINIPVDNDSETAVKTHYVASINESGNIDRIFECCQCEIIDIDDEYIYCYGCINEGIISQQIISGFEPEDVDDPIYAFVKFKIEDTKIK